MFNWQSNFDIRCFPSFRSYSKLNSDHVPWKVNTSEIYIKPYTNKHNMVAGVHSWSSKRCIPIKFRSSPIGMIISTIIYFTIIDNTMFNSTFSISPCLITRNFNPIVIFKCNNQGKNKARRTYDFQSKNLFWKTLSLIYHSWIRHAVFDCTNHWLI
jgi:hypothetical protein